MHKHSQMATVMIPSEAIKVCLGSGKYVCAQQVAALSSAKAQKVKCRQLQCYANKRKDTNATHLLLTSSKAKWKWVGNQDYFCFSEDSFIKWLEMMLEH